MVSTLHAGQNKCPLTGRKEAAPETWFYQNYWKWRKNLSAAHKDPRLLLRLCCSGLNSHTCLCSSMNVKDSFRNRGPKGEYILIPVNPQLKNMRFFFAINCPFEKMEMKLPHLLQVFLPISLFSGTRVHPTLMGPPCFTASMSIIHWNHQQCYCMFSLVFWRLAVDIPRGIPS